MSKNRRKNKLLTLNKIHEDRRGEIYILSGDLKEHEEITLFTTRKDFARGGCIHKFNNEYCIILEGRIRYFIKDAEPMDLEKGQSIKIEKNTPHYFKSLTDSIVLEWGATSDEKKQKHFEYKKRVEEINNLI